MSNTQPKLSSTKQALLEKIKGGAIDTNRPAIGPRRNGREPAPLSFAQQRLWFLDRLEPSSSYNMPAALKVTGLLRIDALEQSLSEISRRHQSLRTTFRMEQGEAVQIVKPPSRFDLSLVSLAGFSKTSEEGASNSLEREEARRRFQLETGPMLRAKLILLGENQSIVLLTMHHIASDGWSLGLLVGELCTLYESFVEGRNSPLRELRIQYVDFAVWQRNWLQGPELEKRLTYWKRQLAGAPQTIDLPSDRSRPAEQSFDGATVELNICPAVTGQLKALSRREGATLFMTLLAGFQTLLYRYVGNPDIVVGSPIANRNHADIEELIGFFVNTLVLRADLSGRPVFTAVMDRVKEAALQAYANQDLPFERLVEEMHPDRSLSFNPLVQVNFALQNAPAGDLKMPGLTFHSEQVDSDTTRFDLEFHVYDAGEEGLAGFVSYSTALFDRTTIQRMAGHFGLLLERIAEDPDRHVAALGLLSDPEKGQLLVQWNDSAAHYPRDQGLTQLFEENADRNPDTVALVMGHEQMSYRELNARANQLAHYLMGCGAGLEQAVGFCMPRSLETVVGMLGILKAGGAYVPLDGEYPRQLLGLMIEQTRIKTVLALDEAAESLSESGVRSIPLKRLWNEIAQQNPRNPQAVAAGDNLACIMFTSGSTGKSKAVGVLHRGVARLVRGANYADLGPEQVFLQMAPMAFDVSTLEIWGPLLNSGRLAILPPGLPSLREIGQAIQRHGVTTLWLTAGLFHQI
ncbi:MAG TPA: condensation domain-containing protein, partial [Blastocatellia bacterium]|nr:condensation domain-containing protein [Blastocatellia bacterium]